MRSRGVLWVLARPLGDGRGRLCRQRRAREDPRSIRQRVDGLDLSGFGSQTERLGRNLQEFGGLTEIEPGLNPVWCRLEHRDPVVRPQGGDALAGPAVAVARLEAV